LPVQPLDQEQDFGLRLQLRYDVAQLFAVSDGHFVDLQDDVVCPQSCVVGYAARLDICY